MNDKLTSRRKRKIGNLLTELDILESALIAFASNVKNVEEVIECVRVFRSEVNKIMKQ